MTPLSGRGAITPPDTMQIGYTHTVTDPTMCNHTFRKVRSIQLNIAFNALQ